MPEDSPQILEKAAQHREDCEQNVPSCVLYQELDPITNLTSLQETKGSKQNVWTIPSGRYRRCRVAEDERQSSKPGSTRRKWHKV